LSKKEGIKSYQVTASAEASKLLSRPMLTQFKAIIFSLQVLFCSIMLLSQFGFSRTGAIGGIIVCQTHTVDVSFGHPSAHPSLPQACGEQVQR